MRRQIVAAAMMLAAVTGNGLAQSGPQAGRGAPQLSSDTSRVDSADVAKSKLTMVPPITIQHVRPQDKRGINMFESPKDDNVAYNGFKLDFGAAFTQQFQDLEHSNTAAPLMNGTTNANQLIGIGSGFNNAVANLYVNAQLAPGIRVAMTSYLSSRHHQETWVRTATFSWTPHRSTSLHSTRS
jgi:hypothetical protein